MKIYVIVLALTLAARAETFTGFVTDSMCGATHTQMNLGPDSDCVRACVKDHKSKYALMVGTKIYKLSDQQTPATYAGKKVTVDGTLYEKTGIIKVDTIQVAKGK